MLLFQIAIVSSSFTVLLPKENGCRYYVLLLLFVRLSVRFLLVRIYSKSYKPISVKFCVRWGSDVVPRGSASARGCLEADFYCLGLGLGLQFPGLGQTPTLKTKANLALVLRVGVLALALALRVGALVPSLRWGGL